MTDEHRHKYSHGTPKFEKNHHLKLIEALFSKRDENRTRFNLFRSNLDGIIDETNASYSSMILQTKHYDRKHLIFTTTFLADFILGKSELGGGLEITYVKPRHRENTKLLINDVSLGALYHENQFLKIFGECGLAKNLHRIAISVNYTLPVASKLNRFLRHGSLGLGITYRLRENRVR